MGKGGSRQMAAPEPGAHVAQVAKRSGGKFFPMYVVRVPDLLSMPHIKPHQVLKENGIVQEYLPGLGPSVFVSHQWCGFHHPDPHFAQLPVLQRALRRLLTVDLRVEVDIYSVSMFNTKPSLTLKDLLPLAAGCVWYDYFSVPQAKAQGVTTDQRSLIDDDLVKALSSIPTYIQQSQFFLVLAPTVPHANLPDELLDYHSWKQRGWCRFERAVRALSPGDTHMLLLRKEDTVFQVASREYLLDAIGDGAFSSEEDRARVAPVILSVMENRLQALLQQNDMHRYRRVLSTRGTVLRNLPGVHPLECTAPTFRGSRGGDGSYEATASHFMRLYQFNSPSEPAGTGTAPVLLAARSGDEDAVKAVIMLKANVDEREGSDDPEFLVAGGSTPLHLACKFSGRPTLVALLLQSFADIEARSGRGCTPLMDAACGPCQDCTALLLGALATVDVTDNCNMTALHYAAGCGRSRSAAMLLASGALPTPNEAAGPALLHACVMNAGRACVEAFVGNRDTPRDAHFRPRAGTPSWLSPRSASWSERLVGTDRKTWAFFVYHCQGATALIAAALMGNAAEARALIAAGAKTTERNAHGKTAEELVELAGYGQRMVPYFQRHA